MLDEIDYGLAVLDQDAGILLANQLAQDELAREKWVRQTGGRFDGCSGADSAKIDQALRDVQSARRSLIALGGRNESLTLSFVPLPLPDDAAASETSRPASLIVFGKREMCETLTLHMFGNLHGLSGAENQLLPAISRGLGAKAMAEQRHVAVSTVRSQLGSIRAKTGVSSVRALMACLTTLPPVRPALRTGAD